MQPTYLRDITEDEKNNLYGIMDNDDAEADYNIQRLYLVLKVGVQNMI